jgi:hypothetical protein
MKTYWWKIGAAAAFVLAAVITARVFWPPKATRITPSTDIGPQSSEQKTARQEPLTESEELYQMALLHKESPSPSRTMDYRMMAACCRQILQEYPDSPEAEKASELLHEVPERYQGPYEPETSSASAGTPKVRKSRTLRRRTHRRYYRR